MSNVNEVPMTEARAILTKIVRDARYRNQVTAFTERGKRVAYVVSPEIYEKVMQALEADQQS